MQTAMEILGTGQTVRIKARRKVFRLIPTTEDTAFASGDLVMVKINNVATVGRVRKVHGKQLLVPDRRGGVCWVHTKHTYGKVSR